MIIIPVCGEYSPVSQSPFHIKCVIFPAILFCSYGVNPIFLIQLYNASLSLWVQAQGNGVYDLPLGSETAHSNSTLVNELVHGTIEVINTTPSMVYQGMIYDAQTGCHNLLKE